MELATIQRIVDVNTVENSDTLDVVTVLGWKVVVKRGEFKSGDLCLYVGLDSILPEIPEFEFLRPYHFRIKTIKLRGQISQGLVFPISVVENITTSLQKAFIGSLYMVGDDLTDALDIKKYEKEIDVHLRGMIAGNFPVYVSKTDEERIQNYMELLEEMRGVECYSSVKIDGTSGTFCNYEGKNSLCSRRNAMQDDGENVYSYIYRKYALDMVFKKYPDIAIQGEIAGPKIQKNRLDLKTPELFVFNVYDIHRHQYFDFFKFIDFCKATELQHVEIDKIFPLVSSLEELLEMARGNYKSGYTREGIVIRPLKERYSNVLKNRFSFKVINNDYKD